MCSWKIMVFYYIGQRSTGGAMLSSPCRNADPSAGCHLFVARYLSQGKHCFPVLSSPTPTNCGPFDRILLSDTYQWSVSASLVHYLKVHCHSRYTQRSLYQQSLLAGISSISPRTAPPAGGPAWEALNRNPMLLEQVAKQVEAIGKGIGAIGTPKADRVRLLTDRR